MNPPFLLDMDGNEFAENDYVIFGDSYKSLRIARVRGIKHTGNSDFVSLEIVKGKGVNRRRYSRQYFPHDFYKIDYETDGTELI